MNQTNPTFRKTLPKGEMVSNPLSQKQLCPTDPFHSIRSFILSPYFGIDRKQFHYFLEVEFQLSPSTY